MAVKGYRQYTVQTWHYIYKNKKCKSRYACGKRKHRRECEDGDNTRYKSHTSTYSLQFPVDSSFLQLLSSRWENVPKLHEFLILPELSCPDLLRFEEQSGNLGTFNFNELCISLQYEYINTKWGMYQWVTCRRRECWTSREVQPAPELNLQLYIKSNSL